MRTTLSRHKRVLTLRYITLLLAISLLQGATGSALAQGRTPTPAIGMWLTVWWTKDDQFHHWEHRHRLPTRGRYTEGDPEVIREQYARMKAIGIDFIIMDDTNGAGADGGRINDNIRAWFDYMDALPERDRIPICIGGGGEMRSGGATAQQQAANFYWKAWAQRPSYFKVKGKPLLLVDTDKNYGPADYTDGRFAVRWAYNGDNIKAMAANRTWGWGAVAPCPILEECMSIWPGHCFPLDVEKRGKDVLEQPREGGQLYARELLRVLNAHPQFMTIADWNNFEEESAIEDSYSWCDSRGYCTPNLYTRITAAYAFLRAGKLVAGEYYRDEIEKDVYLYDGKALVYQGGMPDRACVIVTPVGTLLPFARVRH